MGAPIYISLTSKRTYVSIVALVSELQDNMQTWSDMSSEPD